MQVVTVRIDKVFGNTTIYPVCDTAKKFIALTQRKSFSKEHLKTIESLGYEIKIETPEIV